MEVLPLTGGDGVFGDLHRTGCAPAASCRCWPTATSPRAASRSTFFGEPRPDARPGRPRSRCAPARRCSRCRSGTSGCRRARRPGGGSSPTSTPRSCRRRRRPRPGGGRVAAMTQGVRRRPGRRHRRPPARTGTCCSGCSSPTCRRPPGPRGRERPTASDPVRERVAVRVGLVCPYSFDVPGGVQFHVRDLAEHLIGARPPGQRAGARRTTTPRCRRTSRRPAAPSRCRTTARSRG